MKSLNDYSSFVIFAFKSFKLEPVMLSEHPVKTGERNTEDWQG